jgi:uncharacterized protein YuzE
VKVTYDPEANAVYIAFADDIGRDGVNRTYSCDENAVDGVINLDVDAVGVFLGFEVLDARRLLPAELLAQAERH